MTKVKLEVKLATLPASSQSCTGRPYAIRPVLQLVFLVRSTRSPAAVAFDRYLRLGL